MKKAPYLGRGLLDLLLVLPLGAQVASICCGLSASFLGSEVVFIIAVCVASCTLAWFSFRGGRRLIIRAFPNEENTHSDTTAMIRPSPNFFVRYQPIVFAFGYTALFALIGIFLPAFENDGLFNRFIAVFAVTHFTSAMAVSFVTALFSMSIWWLISPVLGIYTVYGVGAYTAFRKLQAAPTFKNGRLIATVLVLIVAAVFLVRLHLITSNFIPGVSYTETDDQQLTRDYNPSTSTNKLVKIHEPTLTIPYNFPRLDGATAAYPLYAAAAKSIYQIPASGTWSPLVATSTTPAAYEKLLNGEADVIFVAQPSAAQRAAAEIAGRPLKLTPIGKEAFVFFVHADNPVTGLTTEQIRSIYTKRVINWSEVGGAREKILPFQRPDGSGSQTALQLKVMRGEKLPPPLREEFTHGMGGIVQRTAQYRNSRNAIGYSFRFFVTAMNNVKDVKLLKIDGVEPTRENIRSGAYPYTVDVYAVTAGTTNPHVQPLIDWFLSPQGQQLIDDTGYVSLTPAK